MVIDDKVIDVSVKDVIYKLKSELAKVGIQRFKKIKLVGDDLQVTCPIHKDGNESKPSAGITLKDTDKVSAGTIHCFTCGYKATLPKLIEDCFGVHSRHHEFGKQWLLKNFLYTGIIERKPLVVDTRKKVEPRQYISETELEKYRYYHPYMFKRKLTEEIITKFDVGYDKDFIFETIKDGKVYREYIGECITFPTNDEFGNCLFITRRAINKKFFNYPQDVMKPVYGLDKIPKDCKTVIVCESIINALTCWVYGYPAVALLGTGSAEQYEILQRSHIRKYLLGFDGDNAGDNGAKNFIQNMHNYASITKLQIPRGKDINDLSKEEFKNILESSEI